MDAAADLPRDDDSPPPSGVRLRVPEARALRLARPAAPVAEPDVLAEVTEEVFFEVWDVVRAFAPLRGRWLRLGLRQLGEALVTIGCRRQALPAHPANMLRECWPDLVPGYAAMDRLAGVMVDVIC